MVMLLTCRLLVVKESAIALTCARRLYRLIVAGCRAYIPCSALAGVSALVRNQARTEGCMVHLGALVDLPVPYQLGLLLLQLEVGDGLRSRGHTATAPNQVVSAVLERFQSGRQVLI